MEIIEFHKFPIEELQIMIVSIRLQYFIVFLGEVDPHLE